MGFRSEKVFLQFLVDIYPMDSDPKQCTYYCYKLNSSYFEKLLQYSFREVGSNEARIFFYQGVPIQVPAWQGVPTLVPIITSLRDPNIIKYLKNCEIIKINSEMHFLQDKMVIEMCGQLDNWTPMFVECRSIIKYLSGWFCLVLLN